VGADDKDLEDIPRLPRGKGLKLDGPMMFRIGATLILLIMIVLMRRPCADATSKFITGFGSDEGSGSVAKPGTIDLPAGSGSGSGSASATGSDNMEYVGGSASDAEVRAAWERAKAKSHAEQGSGSGSAAGSGSGSGAPR
jgi:hypothetical protein